MKQNKGQKSANAVKTVAEEVKKTEQAEQVEQTSQTDIKTIRKPLKIDKATVLGEVKRYFFMVVGCIFYSIALEGFLIPSSIIGGGISGAASLINIKTGLPAGVFIVVLNVPILICGFRLMGWKFILRCFITTAALGGFTELAALVFSKVGNITDNKLLATIYGGILQGAGIGLFIKYETSSGGTELLGRITNHLLPRFSIAVQTSFFDAIIVIVSAIVLKKADNVLYALILIFVSTKVSDLLIMGLNRAKLCYIVTDNAEYISSYLIEHSPRGVTLLRGEGMYSKTEKGVLLTCVKNGQIVKLKQWVKQLDPHAFVIVCDATEVYGQGFHNM